MFYIPFQYDLVGEIDRKGDRAPKKRATDIIDKLDTNGDKKLNKEEFIVGYEFIRKTSLFSNDLFHIQMPS